MCTHNCLRAAWIILQYSSKMRPRHSCTLIWAHQIPCLQWNIYFKMNQYKFILNLIILFQREKEIVLLTKQDEIGAHIVVCNVVFNVKWMSVVCIVFQLIVCVSVSMCVCGWVFVSVYSLSIKILIRYFNTFEFI